MSGLVVGGRLAYGVALTAYVVVFVVAWRALPERVPMHFDAGGAADSYGSRDAALIGFAVLGVAMGGLLGGLALGARRIPRELINIPARTRSHWFATPEREQELRARLGADLWWVGALTMVLLTLVQLSVVVVAEQPQARLPWWCWVGLAAYLLGIGLLIARTIRMTHRVPDA